jgi:hypothetical protein
MELQQGTPRGPIRLRMVTSGIGRRQSRVASGCYLGRSPEEAASTLRFEICKTGTPAPLSSSFPLENTEPEAWGRIKSQTFFPVKVHR